MRLILLFLSGLVLGQDSVSIGISKDAVNLFSGPIGGQIANIVNGMSWPEIDGSADALDYELTGLTVTSFTMNSFQTTLSNGVITVTVSDDQLNLEGDLAVGEKVFGHFQKIFSAHFTASAQPTVVVPISLTTANGVPQVTVGQVQFSLGNWKISISKYIQWLLDLFKGQIGDDITKAVISSLGPAVQSAANSALAQLPVKVKIVDSIGLDWSLTSSPVIVPSGATADSRGAIYNTASGQYAPFGPPRIPDASTASPVNLILGQNIIENIGYEFWKAGRLSGSSTFNITLGSSNIEVAVTGNLTASPLVQITKGVGGDLIARGEFEMTMEGLSGYYGFNLSSTFVLETQADATFYPKVINITFTGVDELSGNLPLPATWVQSQLNQLTPNITVTLNADLAAVAFQIPTIAGITFSDPALAYLDSAVSVTAQVSVNSN